MHSPSSLLLPFLATLCTAKQKTIQENNWVKRGSSPSPSSLLQRSPGGIFIFWFYIYRRYTRPSSETPAVASSAAYGVEYIHLHDIDAPSFSTACVSHCIAASEVFRSQLIGVLSRQIYPRTPDRTDRQSPGLLDIITRRVPPSSPSSPLLRL